MLKLRELRQAKGKASAEVQETVDHWVKTRGELNTRGLLQYAGFDAKTVDKMVDAAIENAQAEADAEAEAQAKAEKKSKGKNK